MLTLLASMPATTTDKVFGTFLFLSFIAFILFTALDMLGTIRRWLDKKRPAESQGVNLTLNQMYGDVHADDRDLFKVWAAERLRQQHKP